MSSCTVASILARDFNIVTSKSIPHNIVVFYHPYIKILLNVSDILEERITFISAKADCVECLCLFCNTQNLLELSSFHINPAGPPGFKLDSLKAEYS